VFNHGFTVGTLGDANNRSSVDAAFHERRMTREGQELISALRAMAAFAAVCVAARTPIFQLDISF
jgi:hypothetical protein